MLASTAQQNIVCVLLFSYALPASLFLAGLAMPEGVVLLLFRELTLKKLIASRSRVVRFDRESAIMECC